MARTPRAVTTATSLDAVSTESIRTKGAVRQGSKADREIFQLQNPALVGLEANQAALAEMVDRSGLRRVQLLAWRDLDDPEAGGSELHAHRVATAWARAGLDVTVRTSSVAGEAVAVRRDGYTAVRRTGRYAVFPRTALEGLLRSKRADEGLVEIWNGMPFFSPLWAHCPRVVFLHHVHAEMWQMALPPTLARLGSVVERHLAPPLYRGARVVTLSSSSADEIVDQLGLQRTQISVVPPGVETRFSPGGTRSPVPLVVAAGRLVPVKRFDILIDALVALRFRHPNLRAVIVGEGYERPHLEALVRARNAHEWLSLPGRLDDADLVDHYRRAWAVASASLREGWGMTLTEAGACGTPAVATRIAGHLDAVEDGVSGLLVRRPEDLVDGLDTVLADASWRAVLGKGALERAQELTWERTALGTFEALADEAARRR